MFIFLLPKQFVQINVQGFGNTDTQSQCWIVVLIFNQINGLARHFNQLGKMLLLGRDQAVNLGLNYRRDMLWILFWIAVLTATDTALVGPVSFFGLLVVALSDRFCGSIRHSLRLPMAFLTASVLLVGGQTVFEHLLGMKAVLSVVIEFAGGLVFLWLVLRKPK